jgi:hypothetical protein
MIQLQDIISTDLLRTILLYVIVFLAGSTFLLFVVLVTHKLAAEIREKRKLCFKKAYVAMIGEFQIGGKGLARPKTALEYEALTEVCIDVFLSITGETAMKVKELIGSLSLISHYKRMAASRSWIKRHHAVEKLGFFKMRELKEYFLVLLAKERRYEIRARILWALSLIADPDILVTITEELSREASRSSKFNEYIYANIIKSFRDEGVTDRFVAFVERIRSDENIPLSLKRDIVEACGSSGLHEATNVMASYFSLDPGAAELKITSVRALGRVGGSGANEIISQGFEHDDWRIRAVSAGSAHLCGAEVIPSLRKLLYDQVYFVRINASKSLARFGEAGLAALECEVDSPDKFVRDTARFILEEQARNA